MSENPLVSVIVLNYNAGELLLNCIESVKKSAYKNLEIIVVDNISTDKSQKICKEKHPDIKLIQNDENFGYCEGNNIGIREAEGDYIIILNPDTIVESNWIEELISAYNKFGEGLYQPKILSLDKTEILQSTGNMLHIFGFGFARDKGKNDNLEKNTIEKIGYASGTCLFTSKKVLKQVKGQYGRRKNTIRVAKQALEKAMQYAYRDRRAKKREFRSLWIQRINAGVRAEGITYSKFINGLNKSGIKLDRKVLADIAYNNPEVFKSIVKKVQSSLN